MLQIKNLTYQIKNHIILNNISADFPENKITAIIGTNGCGKSTLLAHISRLLKSKKKISLDSTYIEDIPAKDYACKVAILSQQQAMTIQNFLVKDIVLMGRYPHKKRFSDYAQDDISIATTMMARTGIETLAHKRIGTLSGGERQRVFITRALAQEPDILLLDEPTNHLDVKYKVGLMRQLQNLHKTIIVVLHDLSLAAQYCDNTIVMQDGNIKAIGNARKTLTPELLEQIFEVPFYSIIKDNKYFLYY